MTQLALFDEPAALPASASPPPVPSPLSTIVPDAAVAPGVATAPDTPARGRELRLDGHRVGYTLRRARRKTIGFAVGADGLAVSAPRWVTLADIESALRSKSGWILRKLHEQGERARRLESMRIVWRDGVVLPYLGAPLAVVLDGRCSGSELQPGPERVLRVGLPAGAEAAQIRDAVQSWLQRQARQVFEQRCAEFAARLGVCVRRLSLSSAATRWGSAGADGSVRLNWRLVHFALPVIDYVVAHELAHLREMNHSPAFWDVVRSVLPDYESARGALRDELLPAL